MDTETIDKLTLTVVTQISQDKAKRVSPDFATKPEIDRIIATSLDRLTEQGKLTRHHNVNRIPMYEINKKPQQ